MSSKSLSAVRCCCSLLLFTAVHCCCLLLFTAVRVIKQLTVSDQQLILLKLRMAVTVKVNLIRCDIRRDVRERSRVPSHI